MLEAKRECDLALEAQDNFGRALVRRARVFELLGRNEEAIKDLEAAQSVRITPATPPAAPRCHRPASLHAQLSPSVAFPQPSHVGSPLHSPSQAGELVEGASTALARLRKASSDVPRGLGGVAGLGKGLPKKAGRAAPAAQSPTRAERSPVRPSRILPPTSLSACTALQPLRHFIANNPPQVQARRRLGCPRLPRP